MKLQITAEKNSESINLKAVWLLFTCFTRIGNEDVIFTEILELNSCPILLVIIF